MAFRDTPDGPFSWFLTSFIEVLKMISLKNMSSSSWTVMQLWALLLFSLGAQCGNSEVAVRLLTAPHAVYRWDYANFSFEAVVNGECCEECITNCKLDDGLPEVCENGSVSYARLQDGNHTFEVCANASQGAGCAGYKWSVDTIPPTATLKASTNFTNASKVPVYISFSEPCIHGEGFRCFCADDCNLIVQGAGQVVPHTLNVIEPNLKFSITVNLSTSVQYGNVTVSMDNNFCRDSAGNRFTSTENSILNIYFDRRIVFANLTTRIPEKLIQINRQATTVLATNKAENVKVYFDFSVPVLNSSAEVMKAVKTSLGSLLPISGNDFGNSRFGFQVKDLPAMAILTVSLASNHIISRQGTPVSPVAPVTFLYDSRRPAVNLSTIPRTRTKDERIPVLIKFQKPVFSFSSLNVTISGGHLDSFQELNWSSTYIMLVQANESDIYISIPANITEDVAGNRNLGSDVLHLRHHPAPVVSLVLSSSATATFAVASLAAGFHTISTAGLQSVATPSPLLTSDPTSSLFRMASHIQLFALSWWLAVSLPVEYSEFARGLQWSIPYLSLPWEKSKFLPFMGGSNSPINPNSFSSKIHFPGVAMDLTSEKQSFIRVPKWRPPPLMDYNALLENQSTTSEAENVSNPQSAHGWRDFKRSMFWLAVTHGSLILLHALLLLILWLRNKKTKKIGSYGALLIPRFEIFLLDLALSCICEASTAVVKGGTPPGMVVGILLLAVVFILVLALFLFLYKGITLGKLLHYVKVPKERENDPSNIFQEILLGPDEGGQWFWNEDPESIYQTMLGPLFEDLRGPPMYTSQITAGNVQRPRDRIVASGDETEDKERRDRIVASGDESEDKERRDRIGDESEDKERRDRIVASGDETEDRERRDRIVASADETEVQEAPFIQKVFGNLRIYYKLLEVVKRVTLGTVAGAYSDSKNQASSTPAIILLCVTSFQLFFLVLEKPFIDKIVQLVEIISVSCEVGIFATFLVLSENKFSAKKEKDIGIFMLSLFVLAFLAQSVNQIYAFYSRTKKLDPDGNFWSGLKIALIGFLQFFRDPEDMSPGHKTAEDEGTTTSSGDRRSNSRSSGERPWLRQLRELARFLGPAVAKSEL